MYIYTHTQLYARVWPFVYNGSRLAIATGVIKSLLHTVFISNTLLSSCKCVQPSLWVGHICTCAMSFGARTNGVHPWSVLPLFPCLSHQNVMMTGP